MSSLAAQSPASPSASRLSTAQTVGALAGLAWNLYGVIQFIQTSRSTPKSLMEMGMTPEQAITARA